MISSHSRLVDISAGLGGVPPVWPRKPWADILTFLYPYVSRVSTQVSVSLHTSLLDPPIPPVTMPRSCPLFSSTALCSIWSSRVSGNLFIFTYGVFIIAAIFASIASIESQFWSARCWRKLIPFWYSTFLSWSMLSCPVAIWLQKQPTQLFGLDSSPLQATIVIFFLGFFPADKIFSTASNPAHTPSTPS